ncbi:MAG: gliding motility-associated C-terminal domain-containing protein [Bacteroidales bacterium]|nr:gliding motility-associated C-terminal domain-containing protein [Bacteroidales bacterium]
MWTGKPVILWWMAAAGVFCFPPVSVWGQFTSGNAVAQLPTDYTNPRQDTIFIFNPETAKGSLSIAADNPTGDYEWYRYDHATKKFADTPFAVVSGATSQIDTLSAGGYMVKVQTLAARDSFVAWVYLNPGFQLDLRKNESGAVIYSYKTCEYTSFQLATPLKESSFEYYNPANPTDTRRYSLFNTVLFTVMDGKNNYVPVSWSSGQQFLRIWDPPYEDTRYTFTARDRFGVEDNDDILYETIVPHAIMDVQLPEKERLADGNETNPNSAPVEVRINSRSTKATEYSWRFGDGDSARYGGEYPPLPDAAITHTYTIPEEYTVSLRVTSAQGCQNTVTYKFRVDPSKLDVGNVFSPNSDGINDYFKPENTSIRQFEISIYTRAGKKVYQYKGNDLHHWIGWDGRVNGEKDAAEGIYYYVLRAIGWDNTDYGWRNKKNNNDTYRSYVYLYR